MKHIRVYVYNGCNFIYVLHTCMEQSFVCKNLKKNKNKYKKKFNYMTPLHNFFHNAPINESMFDWLSQFITSWSRFKD